ncbi:MAG TPA: protease inhibitor I42 family protein [Candidatus Limnocylindrales bacterium]|nr:protease inhibitor I42 family protein [Candidatus Limnocylindrales bacterium]
MTADVGIPFDIRLAATPTSGDGWEVAALPPGVELLGSESAREPGSGDPSVFRLRAGHAGRFEVRFVAQRRWEQEPIEIRVVAVEAVGATAPD